MCAQWRGGQEGTEPRWAEHEFLDEWLPKLAMENVVLVGGRERDGVSQGIPKALR
jgi:hypothetical protein